MSFMGRMGERKKFLLAHQCIFFLLFFLFFIITLNNLYLRKKEHCKIVIRSVRCLSKGCCVFISNIMYVNILIIKLVYVQFQIVWPWLTGERPERLIVCQSWLLADLGFGSVGVVCLGCAEQNSVLTEPILMLLPSLCKAIIS